jgi:hypothetical protein
MNSLVPSTKIERASTATTRGTRLCDATAVLMFRPTPTAPVGFPPC